VGGWNFAYSGASTLLAGLNEQQKHRVQGINETGIALFATLGAFLPAPILSSSDGSMQTCWLYA
jgi:hypothetical protein